jgi:DNA-binding GntR family transcriptional regulator
MNREKIIDEVSAEAQDKTSKQGAAYNYLRSAIITGKLPPEKPLIEREICEKLNVSRTPVREALRRLGSEGLVEFVPNRGVFVAGLTKDRTTQLYEMKEALECMAAKLCAERASDEDIERMAECIEKHRLYAAKNEMEIAVDLDLKFHVLLVESAKSGLIEQQAKSLLLQTRRLSQLAVYDTDKTENFISQHEEILLNIRNHDAGAAAAAVSRHIRFIEQFQWERWGMLF